MGLMISLRNVSKVYRGAHSANEVCVLTDFNLDVNVGEFVALTCTMHEGLDFHGHACKFVDVGV